MKNKIKEYRINLKLSVYQLAKMTNLTPGYISNLENNKRDNPSREVMRRIAQALNSTVVDVFF